jgi:hypothetical protein
MLIVGGDSWSCWPQEEFYGSRDKCWPSITSKKLNLSLVDNSRAGCSNDRIFRYCLPSVLEYPNSIVVIFWSSSDRFEVGYNGKIEQIQPSNTNNKFIEKSYIKNNLDLYLRYINTLLYSLSLQEICKKNNSILLQKFVFTDDCWWDGTLKSFKNFLLTVGLFHYLSDDQILEKYNYLKTLHSLIDTSTWIGSMRESLTQMIETSEKFLNHPTDYGHEQMAKLILDNLK